MLRASALRASMALALPVLAACGGSSSSDISEVDPIVGVWSKVDELSTPGRESRKEVYLILNGDGTHEWLGKYVDVVGTTAKTTTTAYTPCGKGTYVFANGTLSLTGEMRTYQYNASTTTFDTITKTERTTHKVELLDGAIRLDGADVYTRATRPEGEYCPAIVK